MFPLSTRIQFGMQISQLILKCTDAWPYYPRSSRVDILLLPHRPITLKQFGFQSRLVDNFLAMSLKLAKAVTTRTFTLAVNQASMAVCHVLFTSNYFAEHEIRELLKNTGFELIRAKRGDPIPPNAVMTGVTEADGSLFVGRVGGSIPCYITTDDGKIQSFVYETDTEKRVANGEVMVLTR